MDPRIYSSKQVIVTAAPKGFAGPTLILSDAAPTSGTFVEVALDSDESTVVGTMNGGVVNLMPSTTGKISVTIRSSGEQNNHLSDARRYQKREGQPRAYSVQVKDMSGKSLYHAPCAIIQGAPAVAYAEEIPSLIWVFICPTLDMDHRESNILGVP